MTAILTLKCDWTGVKPITNKCIQLHLAKIFTLAVRKLSAKWEMVVQCSLLNNITKTKLKNENIITNSAFTEQAVDNSISKACFSGWGVWGSTQHCHSLLILHQKWLVTILKSGYDVLIKSDNHECFHSLTCVLLWVCKTGSWYGWR